MKDNKQKLDENIEVIMKKVNTILRQHKIKGVSAVGLRLGPDDVTCDPGYRKVCKTYRDPRTGNLTVKCRCIKIRP